MKLSLIINSKALRDDTRALASRGILVTPAIDESFWLYKVDVSDKQAIVGFPKFGVIGIGFQHEHDNWNTNLPSDVPAEGIYNHIKCNKGDKKIPKSRCIKAIQLIKDAVAESYKNELIENLSKSVSDTERLDLLGKFLRVSNLHEVSVALGR